MRNVVLVGYRGTGKSSVARILGERLGCPVVSTDAEVVRRAGRAIPELVRDEGWNRFRAIESEVVRELTARTGSVIDTGGGAVLDPDSRRMLRECGEVFWLQASVGRIAGRIADDSARPPLTPGGSVVDEIEGVLSERAELYREVAHHTIASEEQSPGEVADAILRLIAPTS